AGAGARIAQAGDDDITLAQLAVADGDGGTRLPQVPLADLAGAIDGALKGALGQKQRAHLAQVVIDDRLAADKAERLDQLPDPDARQLRVLAKQPVDLLLERIELGRSLRAAEARRRIGAQ